MELNLPPMSLLLCLVLIGFESAKLLASMRKSTIAFFLVEVQYMIWEEVSPIRLRYVAKLLEGKETSDIAKECSHDPLSVDKYLLELHRVKFCRKKGMSKEEIAFSIQRSVRLVEEYLKLIEEIEHQRTK